MSLTIGVSTPTPILTIKETQKKKRGYGWQVWHATGATCPEGSVPIRKFEDSISHRIYEGMNPSASSDRATRGHQYAIAYMDNQPHIYGTKATINVWDPIVESLDDFSLAQVWLTSGKYETNDISTRSRRVGKNAPKRYRVDFSRSRVSPTGMVTTKAPTKTFYVLDERRLSEDRMLQPPLSGVCSDQ